MGGTTQLQWVIVGALVTYELFKLAKKNGWLPNSTKGSKPSTEEKRNFAIIGTIAVAIAAWPLWLSHYASTDNAAVKRCITEQTESLPSNDMLPDELKAQAQDARNAAADLCRQLHADGRD
jgi:hypothetical protein